MKRREWLLQCFVSVCMFVMLGQYVLTYQCLSLSVCVLLHLCVLLSLFVLFYMYVLLGLVVFFICMFCSVNGTLSFCCLLHKCSFTTQLLSGTAHLYIYTYIYQINLFISIVLSCVNHYLIRCFSALHFLYTSIM